MPICICFNVKLAFSKTMLCTKNQKSLVFDNGKCTIEHLKFKKYTTIKYRESKYFLIYWFYCWIFDSLYWMKNDKWNKRGNPNLSLPSFDRYILNETSLLLHAFRLNGRSRIQGNDAFYFNSSASYYYLISMERLDQNWKW